MSSRYEKSENQLKKALEVIPLGSQTFSKSHVQFPYGASPYFLDHGKGAYVWDIDGNKYIDSINGLLSISLGYCDEEVDNAIKDQLNKGVSFSLATTLEEKLARKLIEIVPSAEMVRFGKNGTDATSGAIRIARAVTGREHVAVCGYHGWQDWYIASTTRDLGIPKATKELTHKFEYNNIDSVLKLFERNKGKIAAVIMEPMNTTWPKDNFLQQVNEIAHANGALFILDETITGFRYALGGAQEFFNVKPDLATFGKGMGNGYPISALVGKKEYMDFMSEVFLSSTFGGEALSLAASYAVINKMQSRNVPSHIYTVGQKIIENLNQILNDLNLKNTINVSGHPSWSFINFSDYKKYTSWDIKTLFMQECMKRGLLTFGTHNISFSYTEIEIEFMNKVYIEVFELIKEVLENNTLHENLNCEPLKPLFKVR